MDDNTQGVIIFVAIIFVMAFLVTTIVISAVLFGGEPDLIDRLTILPAPLSEEVR